MGKNEGETTTVKNSDGSTTKTTTTTTTQKNSDGSTTITVVMNVSQNPPCPGGGGGHSGRGSKSKGSRGSRSKDGSTKGKKTPKNSYTPTVDAPLPGGLTEVEAEKRMKRAPRLKNTTDREFMKEVVNTHNMFRAKHGIQPLAMDEDLNDVAQAYANKLAQRGDLEPSPNGFGENTFWSNNLKNGKQVVEAWYAEVSDYNFKNISPQVNAAHMTQVLWKSSVKLGIAMAKGKDGYYVVANYRAPGNHVAKYAENIFPPKKG